MRCVHLLTSLTFLGKAKVTIHLLSPPPRTPKRQVTELKRCAANVLGVITLFAAAALSATALARAPYLKADKPIIDDQGRVQVIIDFTDDAHLLFAGRLPILPARAASAAEASTTKPIEFFHTEKALALVAEFEKRYGFNRIGMTSWVGNSVTTAIPVDVIETLRTEKLVKQISQDENHKFSSVQTNVMPSGGWANTAIGNEWTSWGHQAVNGKVFTTQNNLGIGRKIYIIDSGVAYHDDLPTMTRLNVTCGLSGACNIISPTLYPLVGCYAHATHVAGIIGATANNDKTIRGAYAGFPNMVSLAVTRRTPGGLDCADSSDPDDPAAPSSNIGYALDYIAFDATQNNPNRLVNIATMSINAGGAAYNNGNPGPNWAKVKSLTTTIWAYGSPEQPGVFFVQSAGNGPANNVSDGCFYAYQPGLFSAALPDDGVMVVGASHANGGAVTSDRPYSKFTSPFNNEPTLLYPLIPQSSTATSSTQFSYDSQCVDIWAPGNLILSLWGIHANIITNNITLASAGYSGSVSTPIYGSYNANGTLVPSNTTQGWAFLSGTSMAAPFVAAAAAWLADTYGYSTPGALEQAVRSNYTMDTSPNPGQSFPAVPVVRLP